MKIRVLVYTACALLLALAPATRTRAQDGPAAASFDLFYNNLADDGNWYSTPEYGYVWQPNIAGPNSPWRPYSDGYWAQTDAGWTWVSYESFGWATYHYGRWTRLNDLGWAWVPGYDWGPGWVAWRTSNDYVGWAPLPPEPVAAPGVDVAVDYNVVEPVSEGYTPAVDASLDIGPQNYCFVTCANFGAPVLSAVFLPPQQNFTIIQNTVNVTNIYYNNTGGQTVVYNRGGPDYNFISTRVNQPIQRLQLQQNTDPNYLRGNHPAGFNPTQVRGGVLQVAAPAIARGPVNFQQVKPPRVKATLAKAEVVHGWSGVNASPQQVEQARQQVKQQAQNVPKREANGNIPLPGRTAPSAPAITAERVQKPAATPGRAPAVGNPGPHQIGEVEKPASREQPHAPGVPAAAAPTPARLAHPSAPAPEAQPREIRPTPPAAAAPREGERAPEPTPREQAVRPAAPRPAEPQHTPESRPAAPRPAEPQHTPESRPAAPRPIEEQHTPEPRPAAPRPPERTPEARPTPERAAEAKPTPNRDADRARAEAARRDEAAKKTEDKRNPTPPQ